MNNKDLLNKIISVLKSAYEADPAAIHALICNRVPCNNLLADHPTIVVDINRITEPESYSVGLMGIINGICEEVAGGRIAAQFSDENPHKLIGFQAYSISNENS